MVSSLVYFWMNGLNPQHLTLISLATHSIKRGAVVIIINKTKANPSNQNEDASCIAYIEETQERWGYSLWLWFNSGDIATPVWRKELCHFARVLYMYVDRACRFPTGGIVFSLLFPFTKTTLLHFVRYAICILYFTLLFATVLLFIQGQYISQPLKICSSFVSSVSVLLPLSCTPVRQWMTDRPIY